MKASTRQTIGYLSAFFILGSVIASLGPTLPDLANQVGKNVPALSVLFSTRSLGYLCGSLLTGVLLDRIPGHRLLAAALMTGLLLLFIIPEVSLLTLLGLVLFLVGCTLGSLDVGSNTLIAQTHGEKSGPYLNAMYLSAGVGSFLIPLYFGYVAPETGYQSLALLIAPLVCWMILTPSPPKPSQDEAEDPLPDQREILILFAFLALLFVGLEVGYSGWIFTYYQQRAFGPDHHAYTITSLFWIAVTLGRTLAIPTAVYIQPIRSIFSYLIGGLVSTGLMIFFPEQNWSVWVGTAGVGLSLAALFPTTYNYIQKTTQFTGKQNGIVWAVGSLGGITLPYLIGWGIGTLRASSMMVFVLFSWLLALILFLTILHRKQDLSRLLLENE